MIEVGGDVAGQRQHDRRLPASAIAFVDQPQRDVGLVDATGLTDAAVVEAHEVGLLRRVRAHELLVPDEEALEPAGELAEVALAIDARHRAGARDARVEQRRFERLDRRHAAPPAPNTSTSANRHGGDAWPTRITWFGSPLPQNGVPMTSSALSSPTAFRLRQNVADTPR